MTACTFKSLIYPDYICTIRDEKNISDPITLKGEHIQGYSTNFVHRLDIENCDFVTFPKNLQDLLPNVAYLYIKDCNLEHLGRDHIGKWTFLKTIIITGCNLRRLNGDFFSGLETLEGIDFHENKIEEIEPEIFDDLKKLSYIDFRRNKNINIRFQKDSKHSCSLEEFLEEIRFKCKSVSHPK
jgi:Leucine-rich repeat (LRR) protein